MFVDYHISQSISRDSGINAGSFNFKELLGFTSFFKDPVRLGNQTYRTWDKNSIEKWTIE